MIFLLFIGCKKNAPDDKTVSGKWEWVKTYGSFPPREFTPQSTGRSWTLTLNTDLTCTQSGDFTSSMGLPDIKTGTYRLSNVHQINSSRTEGEIMISFLGPGSFIKKSQDTLFIDQGLAIDLVAHLFVKK